MVSPKYAILKEQLKVWISETGLQEHDKFLSVAEIEQRFDVSSITIRHALRELQNDGTIYSIKKKGSFIAPTYKKTQTFYLIYGPGETSPEVQEKINLGLRAYQEMGNNVRMVPVHVDKIKEQANQLIHLNPDLKGVIFYRTYSCMLDLRPVLDQANISFIYFGSDNLVDSSILGCPQLIYSESEIMQKAIAHLSHQGRKHIGFMGDQDKSTSNRCVNYLEQLFRFNSSSPLISIIEDPSDFPEVRNAIDNLSKQVDAIICSTDRVAVKAIQMLRQKGMDVPKDISVIGIDNSFLCDFVDPKCCSVDLGFPDAITKCLDFLDHSSKDEAQNVQFHCQIQVISRESSLLPPSHGLQ
jgi:GntR family transcriptional regulator of arabinose operon